MTAAVYAAAAQQRLAQFPRRSRRRAAMAEIVRTALPDAGWHCDRALRTVTDIAVFTVRGPRGQSGVLKVTTTRSGMAELRRERDVLGQLGADERLGEWRAMLPVPLNAGDAGPGAFLLTSLLPGQDARDVLLSAGLLTHTAADAVAPLHLRTQAAGIVGDALLDPWVDQPAEQIRVVLPSKDGAIGRLTTTLRAELAGRTLTLGWAHGDLHPGNLLVGADGQATGIVDWGGARERDLPALDIAFWLLTVASSGEPREFGQRVAARLNSGRFWTSAESHLLDSATGGAPGGRPDGRTLLLLTWLRHVGGNLAKSERYAGNPLWIRWNVLPVLRQVTRG